MDIQAIIISAHLWVSVPQCCQSFFGMFQAFIGAIALDYFAIYGPNSQAFGLSIVLFSKSCEK